MHCCPSVFCGDGFIELEQGDHDTGRRTKSRESVDSCSLFGTFCVTEQLSSALWAAMAPSQSGPLGESAERASALYHLRARVSRVCTNSHLSSFECCFWRHRLQAPLAFLHRAPMSSKSPRQRATYACSWKWSACTGGEALIQLS